MTGWSRVHMDCHATGLAIDRHRPANNNAITLRIEHGEQATAVTIYGLPSEVTDRLLQALGPPIPEDEWAHNLFHGSLQRQVATASAG